LKKCVNFKIFGSEIDTKPLIICHGLFGNLKNWHSIASDLEKSKKKVILMDMRNHGNSFWDPLHTYKEMSNDIKQIVDNIGTKVDILGHSMGGKAAMYFSSENYDLINKLVVVDIAPVNYPDSWSPLLKILLKINFCEIKKRSDFEEILYLQGFKRDVILFLSQNLIRNEKNSYSLRFNINAINNNLKDILSYPKNSNIFNGEILFIKGSNSDYINKKNFEFSLKTFPNAKLEIISNCGHWVHYEKKESFLKVLCEFLEN
tara:strand:- start:292 stop:1071 length:780 start_codon:yes stop_codon:yes gene_type:complete